jgi:hypothetical protein
MLLAAFGPSPRDAAKPDTRAAAERLGVSQRTVQRWIASAGHQRSKPKGDTLGQLAKMARQAASTKAGRARAAKQAFGGAAPTDMRVSVRGRQGPVTSSESSIRPDRWSHFDLDDPALASAFIDAWVERGEKGAFEYMSENSDILYATDGWYFDLDAIERFDISGPYGSDR